MGHPKATRSTCDFVVLLANLVTAFSEYTFDWVARKGRYGIFELLQNLAPKVFLLIVY